MPIRERLGSYHTLLYCTVEWCVACIPPSCVKGMMGYNPGLTLHPHLLWFRVGCGLYITFLSSVVGGMQTTTDLKPPVMYCRRGCGLHLTCNIRRDGGVQTSGRPELDRPLLYYWGGCSSHPNFMRRRDGGIQDRTHLKPSFNII